MRKGSFVVPEAVLLAEDIPRLGSPPTRRGRRKGRNDKPRIAKMYQNVFASTLRHSESSGLKITRHPMNMLNLETYAPHLHAQACD